MKKTKTEMRAEKLGERKRNEKERGVCVRARKRERERESQTRPDQTVMSQSDVLINSAYFSGCRFGEEARQRQRQESRREGGGGESLCTPGSARCPGAGLIHQGRVLGSRAAEGAMPTLFPGALLCEEAE